MKHVIFNYEAFSKALRSKRAVELNITEHQAADELGIDIIEYKGLETGNPEVIDVVPFVSVLKALDFIELQVNQFINNYGKREDGI